MEQQAEHDSQCVLTDRSGEFVQPGGADACRDDAEHADRHEPQDPHDDLDQRLEEALEGLDGRATNLADRNERETEQDGDHHGRERLALNRSLERVRRDHLIDEIEEDLADAGWRIGILDRALCGFVARPRFGLEVREVRAGAGFDRVYENEPERDREHHGGDVVEHRRAADEAEALRVADARHADEHRDEHQRDHEHLQRLDEGQLADLLQRGGLLAEHIRGHRRIPNEELPDDHSEDQCREDEDREDKVGLLHLWTRRWRMTGTRAGTGSDSVGVPSDTLAEG